MSFPDVTGHKTLKSSQKFKRYPAFMILHARKPPSLFQIILFQTTSKEICYLSPTRMSVFHEKYFSSYALRSTSKGFQNP